MKSHMCIRVEMVKQKEIKQIYVKEVHTHLKERERKKKEDGINFMQKVQWRQECTFMMDPWFVYLSKGQNEDRTRNIRHKEKRETLTEKIQWKTGWRERRGKKEDKNKGKNEVTRTRDAKEKEKKCTVSVVMMLDTIQGIRSISKVMMTMVMMPMARQIDNQ